MNFETLKELTHTINRNKVKKIEVIGNPGNSDTLAEMLYQGISQGKITSDEDAVQAFYQTDNVNDARYRRVRYRLVRKLLQTALFVDTNQPAFTERVKASHQCHSDFAAANILMFRNARRAGAWFMEQTLQQAIKFEFIDLCVDITKLLKSIYSLSNPKKYKQYFILYELYAGQQQREMMAANYYNQLIQYYISKRAPNSEIHNMATKFFADLEIQKEAKNTIQFHYYVFQIENIRCLSINDSASAIKSCSNAIQLMDANKNANQTAKALLSLQRLVCQTQLRLFEDTGGKASFEYGIKISEKGSFNWFRLFEYYFHHCLHARRYEEAWEIFKQGYQQSDFSKLQGNARDNWHLCGGYCHLLALFGKFDASQVESVVGKFRYARFINNFDVLDHDKTAMNIPLVILPLIYSLAKGTSGEEFLSVEALEKYRKRHLDKQLNSRSIAFINLLISLINHPFEQNNSGEKINKNLSILKKEQIQISRQTVAIEIIPYEDLWEMLTTA